MLDFPCPLHFIKKMCSLIVQRIFKFKLASKYYFLPSATFPIQKSFLSNLTTLEDAYQNAKAYCKGEADCYHQFSKVKFCFSIVKVGLY